MRAESIHWTLFWIWFDLDESWNSNWDLLLTSACNILFFFLFFLSNWQTDIITNFKCLCSSKVLLHSIMDKLIKNNSLQIKTNKNQRNSERLSLTFFYSAFIKLFLLRIILLTKVIPLNKHINTIILWYFFSLKCSHHDEVFHIQKMSILCLIVYSNFIMSGRNTWK